MTHFNLRRQFPSRMRLNSWLIFSRGDSFVSRYWSCSWVVAIKIKCSDFALESVSITGPSIRSISNWANRWKDRFTKEAIQSRMPFQKPHLQIWSVGLRCGVFSEICHDAETRLAQLSSTKGIAMEQWGGRWRLIGRARVGGTRDLEQDRRL